jgi:hypothetical protein
MNNFHPMAQGISVTALMNQIARNKQLWNANDLRSTFPGSPHKQVEDIWLRFQPLDCKDPVNDHESVNYPAFFELSEANDLIFNLMRVVKGERLGRVLVTKLAPGKSIAPHIDGGSHSEYYERFHVVLQGYPGSIFRCGGETVQMLTGEVWWFDNAVEHEVINNSADDRIHLVIDIRTAHKEK